MEGEKGAAFLVVWPRLSYAMKCKGQVTTVRVFSWLMWWLGLHIREARKGDEQNRMAWMKVYAKARESWRTRICCLQGTSMRLFMWRTARSDERGEAVALPMKKRTVNRTMRCSHEEIHCE